MNLLWPVNSVAADYMQYTQSHATRVTITRSLVIEEQFLKFNIKLLKTSSNRFDTLLFSV